MVPGVAVPDDIGTKWTLGLLLFCLQGVLGSRYDGNCAWRTCSLLKDNRVRCAHAWNDHFFLFFQKSDISASLKWTVGKRSLGYIMPFRAMD